MTDKHNKSTSLSDIALLKIIGKFIKHHRLDQNKSQHQLAEEAGINRSTLSEFEQGKRSNTLTLIRLLRSLNQLYILEQFQIEQAFSPLQLAKLEQKKRKRASKEKNTDQTPKYKW